MLLISIDFFYLGKLCEKIQPVVKCITRPYSYTLQYKRAHIPLASSTIIIVQSVDTHNINAHAMKRINDCSEKYEFLSRRNIFYCVSFRLDKTSI